MHRAPGGYQACLLDVHGTVVSVPFDQVMAGLAAIVDVPSEALTAALGPMHGLLDAGRIDLADAFAEVLRVSGRQPDPGVVRALVEADADLLVEHAQVFDDVVPFLTELRRRGVKTAFVTNAAANTRLLLERTGLASLVDEVVLSCETEAVKPEAAIYRRALAALGADPRRTLLIDDRPEYCRGAMALRIDAVVALRARPGEDLSRVLGRADGLPSVSSLAETLRQFVSSGP